MFSIGGAFTAPKLQLSKRDRLNAISKQFSMYLKTPLALGLLTVEQMLGLICGMLPVRYKDVDLRRERKCTFIFRPYQIWIGVLW